MMPIVEPFLSKWVHKEPLTIEERLCLTKGSLKKTSNRIYLFFVFISPSLTPWHKTLFYIIYLKMWKNVRY